MLLVSTMLSAQSGEVANDPGRVKSQVQTVNELSERIFKKKEQRGQLISEARQQNRQLTSDEETDVAEITFDIERLQRTLLLSVTGESTLGSLYEVPDKETTWQEDVIDILKPLADSVKSITRRPREIAELRAQLLAVEQKELGLTDAIEKFNRLEKNTLDARATAYVDDLSIGWQDDLQQLQQENLIISSQLADLLGEDEKPFSGAIQSLKTFALGSGLTLLLALITAVAVYFLMRAGWWLYSRRFVSKDVRRKSTLFRVFSYSYHLITGFLVVLSVVVVIYMRDDLLLLALAFLILAGIIFNLKQFILGYIAEARLLLNLGSVREEERVLYNGIPWQVKSINIYTVLHNPALDGIVRLPLSAIQGLVSRPVKNKIWFPTDRNDYVILPDGTFGQIKHQTPDLVELQVRGGMALTYTTDAFYALNIINLSRHKAFGVSVTFGLDYSLQKTSVTEVPAVLKEAINNKLISEGFEKELLDLMVELSAANASSLDFLVYATVDSSMAGKYYKLQRLILQTCVEVSNERGWTIPYPQLVVHNA